MYTSLKKSLTFSAAFTLLLQCGTLLPVQAYPYNLDDHGGLESQADLQDRVIIKIRQVESIDSITISPLSRHIPSYRIRGEILIPGFRRHRQLYVSIMPSPIMLKNSDYKMSVSIAGMIGSTQIGEGTEFPVEITGNSIPIDLIGTPAIEQSLSNGVLMAGFYYGSFNISARLGI